MSAAPAFVFAHDRVAFDSAVFHARRAKQYRRDKAVLAGRGTAGVGIFEGRARWHEKRVRAIAQRAEVAHAKAQEQTARGAA